MTEGGFLVFMGILLLLVVIVVVIAVVSSVAGAAAAIVDDEDSEDEQGENRIVGRYFCASPLFAGLMDTAKCPEIES